MANLTRRNEAVARNGEVDGVSSDTSSGVRERGPLDVTGSRARIVDGKAAAAALEPGLACRAEAFRQRTGRSPSLEVIWVEGNEASRVYVARKAERARKIGISAVIHRLEADVTQAKLEALVCDRAADPVVDGLIVQLPLPEGLDTFAVLDCLDPARDVDGLHSVNAGLLWQGRLDEALIPCTPQGCMRLIAEARGPELAGKRALVIGRSLLVGKPVAALLLQRNATVTLAHSRTADLADLARQADILVAAAGSPGLVRGDWIKPGALVIDVAIVRSGGHLVGDVAFDEVQKHAGALTPVPGGVGPMTVAMLLANTLLAAERRCGIGA